MRVSQLFTAIVFLFKMFQRVFLSRLYLGLPQSPDQRYFFFLTM